MKIVSPSHKLYIDLDPDEGRLYHTKREMLSVNLKHFYVKIIL